MTDQYPNNYEIRAWGRKVNPRATPNRGALPIALIAGWNRAHPDRPYVKREAYHGTIGGYNNHGCRCDRCREAAAAGRVAYEAKRDSA